ETHSEMKREDRRILTQTILNGGSIVLAVALVLLALRLMFGSVVTMLGAPSAPAAPRPVADANDASPPLLVAAGGPAETAAPPAGQVGNGAPVRNRNGVTNRVSEISRRRPEDAAALIMNMLEEDH